MGDLLQGGPSASVQLVGKLLSEALLENARLLEELGRRTGQLRQEQQKEDLFRGLVHDLKSPMVGADRTLEYLVEKLGEKLPAEDVYLLSLLKETNQRLLATVTNFLETCRYEDGMAESRFQHVRVVPVIRACVKELLLLARSKNVTVNFSPIHSNAVLWADEQAIKSLLKNLLSNAIRFAGDGGKVTVSLHCSKDNVKILVCDSGPGVPEDERSMLFQRFWQSEASRSTSCSTGLGLYLCRQIAEHHGGEIRYELSPELGTTFSVTLPASVGQSGAEVYSLACAPAEAV